ncbi:NikM domain containing protein [Lewinellaceae bacterium SD302]|nr:NikM domain containing protein [Lewinellaceae bacterium SD302]
MKKLFPLAAAFIALLLCSSHDMYLKLDSFFLQPDSKASILLYNGTFAASENVIDRDRMLDVSIVANGQRNRIDTTNWREDDNVTILDVTTGEPGTYVVGVSTKARTIEMEAEAFNNYLAHDGVQDMLTNRTDNDKLTQDANELYSKHVKAIYQVGDNKTSDWKIKLGYPIEFIPRANPYNLKVGGVLPVQLLLDGKPLANQIVTIDSDGGSHAHGHDHEHADGEEHEHDSEDGHTHDGGTQVRTDANGNFTVNIANDGQWYLRTIHMVEVEDEELTHESNWATLTFEVAHGHDHADGDHAHDGDAHTHADGTTHSHEGDDHHHEEGGLPGYVWWLGSLVLVAILFVYFKRQQA